MVFGHGKVILLGEHGVVHGRPALAIAVERGAEAHARRSEGDATTLHIAPWDVTVDDGPTDDPAVALLQRALRLATGLYADEQRAHLEVTMRLPAGAGMGSSAALGVAVLRALDEVRDLTRDDAEIYERSLAWERIFHGNPSGVDNAMATWGGVALFRRGRPLERVLPATPIRIVAAFSGASSSTAEAVASVARQLAGDPARVGRLFDDMEALVLAGRRALEAGALSELGRLMTANHALLQALSLSTPALDDMIAAAMAAGALGAKVTGAGGGGCMIALTDSDLGHTRVTEAMRTLGRDVYDVRAGTDRSG